MFLAQKSMVQTAQRMHTGFTTFPPVATRGPQNARQGEGATSLGNLWALPPNPKVREGI